VSIFGETILELARVHWGFCTLVLLYIGAPVH
jgi:hypothetical protein